MGQLVAKEVTDKLEWEEFISVHEEANFLQSWYWGEFQARLGKQVARIGFYKPDSNPRLEGGMAIVVEEAKRGRYITIAGGPIIDWHNPDSVEGFMTALKDLAKQYDCVFVRVRPQLLEDEFSVNLFKDLGFREAPMHLTADLTRQIDLSPASTDLLSAMRKTTRYEIKKAQKLGIKITTATDPDDIKEFYDYQIETSKRHGFVPFSLPFLREQFAVFADSGHALLYTATHDDAVLAQAFIIFYGAEATYHYGVGTDAGRHLPGAYLIQWEAMQEAKRRGIKRYNLWGVAPEGATNHRFWGVSVFKRGFGGHDVRYLPARDYVINSFKYSLNLAVETARKKIRRV